MNSILRKCNVRKSHYSIITAREKGKKRLKRLAFFLLLLFSPNSGFVGVSRTNALAYWNALACSTGLTLRCLLTDLQCRWLNSQESWDYFFCYLISNAQSTGKVTSRWNVVHHITSKSSIYCYDECFYMYRENLKKKKKQQCYPLGSPCQDPAGSRTTRRPPDHRKET